MHKSNNPTKVSSTTRAALKSSNDNLYCVANHMGYFNPLVRLVRSIGKRVWQDDRCLILKTNLGYFGLYMMGKSLSVYYAEGDADLEKLKHLANA
jgi:hypothetical protein